MSQPNVSQPNVGRRSVLLAAVALAAAGCADYHNHSAVQPRSALGGPDPNETFVLPYEHMTFRSWGDVPPGSGEMASLYGDLNKAGPYLVLMRWHAGWFSAPHTYATDRVCVVVFGTWWVNSGDQFRPGDAVPVGPGGYVKRTARTPHYDGVPASQADPAVIAIFGLGPVDLQLVDPTRPSWRRV